MSLTMTIYSLCDASIKNDILAINTILAKNPELVNTPHPVSGMYPVEYAARHNNFTALKSLSEKNANLKIPNFVYYVLQNADENLIKFLETNDLLQSNGITLLHLKAITGIKNKQELDQLISSNSVNSKDKWGRIPLLLAIQNGQFKTAELLLKNKSSRTFINKWQDIHNSKHYLLHIMAIEGKKEACKFLLDNKLGGNIESEDKHSCTPVILALINNQLETAKFLLSIEGNKAKEKIKYWTNIQGSNQNLLHIVAACGNIEICQYLIDNKLITNIDAEDDNKCTAAILAIQNNHFEVAKLLFEKNASKKKVKIWRNKDNHNGTFLHDAADKANLKLCEFIIDNNLYNNIDTEDDEHLTPLILALFKEVNEKITELLIKNQASKEKAKTWKYKKEYHRTLLHIAAKAGDINTCKYLIENGYVADIDSEDLKKCTPLILAIKYQHYEVVDLLLKYGASREKAKKWHNIQCHDYNLLHYAVQEENLAACKYLVENNFIENIDALFIKHFNKEVDLQNAGGVLEKARMIPVKDNRKEYFVGANYTAIIQAIIDNNIEIANYLLEQGASSELVKTWVGPKTTPETILHLSASLGHLEACKFLIEKNLVNDINHRDSSGFTALIVALNYRQIGVANYLLDCQPNSSTRELLKKWIYTNGSFTCNLLHLVVMTGNFEACQFLFESNLVENNIDAVDSNGNTALVLAIQSCNLEIIEFLLGKNASFESIKNDNAKNLQLFSNAIVEQNVYICKFLLENHLIRDINAKTENNMTLLEITQAFNPNPVIEKLLIDYGAVQNTNRMYFTAPFTQTMEYNPMTGIVTEHEPPVFDFQEVNSKLNNSLQIMTLRSKINHLKHTIHATNEILVNHQNEAQQIDIHQLDKNNKYKNYNTLLSIQKFDDSVIKQLVDKIEKINFITEDIEIELKKIEDNYEKIHVYFIKHEKNQSEKIYHFQNWREENIKLLSENKNNFKDHVVSQINSRKISLMNLKSYIEEFNLELTQSQTIISDEMDNQRSRACQSILNTKPFEINETNKLLATVNTMLEETKRSLTQKDLEQLNTKIISLVASFGKIMQEFNSYKLNYYDKLTAYQNNSLARQMGTKKRTPDNSSNSSNSSSSSSTTSYVDRSVRTHDRKKNIPSTTTSSSAFFNKNMTTAETNTIKNLVPSKPNYENTIKYPPLDKTTIITDPPNNNPSEFYKTNDSLTLKDSNDVTPPKAIEKEAQAAMYYCANLLKNFETKLNTKEDENIWRLSISYDLLMTVNALWEMFKLDAHKNEILVGELSTLRANLKRNVFNVNSHSFTSTILNKLKPIYEQYQNEKIIHPNKVKQFIEHFEGSSVGVSVKAIKENKKNQSEKLASKANKINSALINMKSIFSIIGNDIFNLKVLLDKYPKHYSSLLMLVIHLDTIVEGLSEKNIHLPPHIDKFFNADEHDSSNPTQLESQKQNLHPIANKMSHQMHEKDSGVYKYILMLCSNIDSGIKDTHNWKNTLENSVRELQRATLNFNANLPPSSLSSSSASSTATITMNGYTT